MSFNKKPVTIKADKKPRISVNKLAEYLEATATRRKTIVSDAKYPKTFKGGRYKDAREIMKSYVSSDFTEDDVIDAITEMRKQEPASDYQENDISSSIAALESLLETDLAHIEELEIEHHNESNELVEICGVEVSVNPDLIIKEWGGKNYDVGALKFHISKTNPLSEEGQNVVAMMLHQYAERHLKHDNEKVSQKLCFSFDVFQQNIVRCPSAYKLRMRKIETACEEIVLWWANL